MTSIVKKYCLYTINVQKGLYDLFFYFLQIQLAQKGTNVHVVKLGRWVMDLIDVIIQQKEKSAAKICNIFSTIWRMIKSVSTSDSRTMRTLDLVQWWQSTNMDANQIQVNLGLYGFAPRTMWRVFQVCFPWSLKTAWLSSELSIV